MRAYEDLTHLGQVRRLRTLAEKALPYWQLQKPRITLIQQGENTTYRVRETLPRTRVAKGQKPEAPGAHEPGNYLLRIHRPGYQDSKRVASEIAWLAALRHDTDLPVPEPVPVKGGAWMVEMTPPDGSPARLCTLLRWMNGRFLRGTPTPAHLERVGRLTARLHNHSAKWKAPRGFDRRHWNGDGLFWDEASLGAPAAEAWHRLPNRVHEPFGKVADRTDKIIRALGTGREAYGLVHGDLHLGNVLFVGGEARAIDFDDCGYGPWVYDFAVTLANQWKSRDWPDLRDAFCAGYAAERELPDLADLEMICAGRLVSLGLWLAGLAESGPQARKMFERFLPSVEAGVRRFSERPAGRSKGPRPGRPGPRSRR